MKKPEERLLPLQVLWIRNAKLNLGEQNLEHLQSNDIKPEIFQTSLSALVASGLA